MRYELTDYEWAAIKPFLPNKPRGVPRLNDRRVLNGIFWVLRSGAPWRDLPDNFGPYTTCYNRFVRCQRYRLIAQRSGWVSNRLEACGLGSGRPSNQLQHPHCRSL
jgi:transposase